MKGPYYRSINLQDQTMSATYYRTSNGQKERLPLPYYKTGIAIVSRYQTEDYKKIQGPWQAATVGSFSYYSGDFTLFPRPDGAALYNIAYARWVNDYQKQLQLAVDMVELRKTLQLLAALGAAARRPLRTIAGAWEKYRKQASKKGWKKPIESVLLKDVPDAWLAFHFGLRPLFQSVHDGLAIYSQTQPPTILARGTAKTERTANVTGISGLTWKTQENASFKVKVQSEIVVTNPNLHIANQLGLINPASVAWELIPFSFLVDWFVNIGQVVASLTDTAGVSVRNGFVTTYSHGSGFNEHFGVVYGVYGLERCNFSWVRINRTLGIPTPKLRFKVPNFGITRIATSYALLAQQLGRALAR